MGLGGVPGRAGANQNAAGRGTRTRQRYAADGSEHVDVGLLSRPTSAGWASRQDEPRRVSVLGVFNHRKNRQ